MQALIAQRRVRAGITGNTYEALCPAIRVPLVMNVTANQESTGGWTDGEFTIPAASRRHGLESMPHSALDLPVWIMDGLSRVFHGTIKKAIPDDQGNLVVTCDGDYRLLGGDNSARMRAIWSDGDLTTLTQSAGSSAAGGMTIDSQGRLVFSFQRGSSLDAGDYISADYYAFGEAVGVRDTKKLDSWKLTIGSASTFPQLSNMVFRVYGLQQPADPTPTILQTFTAAGTRMEVSTTGHGGDNTGSWSSTAGYRLIRIGLYVTGPITTPSSDHTAIITNFQVSTRGRANVGLLAPFPSTSAIASDVWTDGQSYDLDAFVVEEEPSGTGKLITGNIPDSGQKAFGIAFKDWTSPQEIIESQQALDGGICGMWGPTRNPPPGSHVVAIGNTSVNYWYRQPAELTYKQWNDLSNPELIVRLGKGAEWTPDGQPDDVVSADYVGYSSLRGTALSVFTEDASAENIVSEQGKHKAADYAIDPSVDTQTAMTLGASYVTQRRQPALSGQLVLYGDRPGSWEQPGGGRGVKLYELRPCIVRIVDAKGAKSGRVTMLQYAARTASTKEMMTLTVNTPFASQLALQTNRLARRAARNRHR